MAHKGARPDPFDPFCRRLVRDHARRIVRSARLPGHEVEDLQQELHLHAWVQAGKFDPERGAWTTYTKTVIERKAASLLHQARAECRSRLREAFSIDDTDPGSNWSNLERVDAKRAKDAVPRRASTIEDLGIDVRRVVARLGRKDRVLAHALMVERVAEVAARTGIPRSTLYGRIGRIRREFEEAGVADYHHEQPTVSRSTA
jgi:RNA polymerase sigma-70 factor (ECF subfamily)